MRKKFHLNRAEQNSLKENSHVASSVGSTPFNISDAAIGADPAAYSNSADSMHVLAPPPGDQYDESRRRYPVPGAETMVQNFHQTYKAADSAVRTSGLETNTNPGYNLSTNPAAAAELNSHLNYYSGHSNTYFSHKSQPTHVGAYANYPSRQGHHSEVQNGYNPYGPRVNYASGIGDPYTYQAVYQAQQIHNQVSPQMYTHVHNTAMSPDRPYGMYPNFPRHTAVFPHTLSNHVYRPSFQFNNVTLNANLLRDTQQSSHASPIIDIIRTDDLPSAMENVQKPEQNSHIEATSELPLIS